MTVLAHMAVGGAVGSFAEGRGFPFALGLLSHVPLDVIPHYEFEKMWLEAAVVVAALGGMILAGYGGTGIFWGALGAVVPDLENLLWRLGILPGRWKMFPGHARWLRRVIPHGRSLSARHVWWQVALVCLSLGVVLRRLPRG